MSDDRPAGGGSDHPAAAAWSRLPGPRGVPSEVQPLGRTSSDWRHHKSAAFRLHDAEGPGASVVAKWHRGPGGATERILYEKILPTLPVPGIPLHGVIEDGEEALWIFLHDVGDDTPRGDAFVRMRTLWLASLHEADLERWGRILPEGGAPRYRAHLAAARPRLRQGLENPVMTDADQALLTGALDALAGIAARWTRLKDLSRRLPPTLVHGDLKAKNLRPGPDGGGLPYVLDWDTVGFGSPAADLESRCVDLDLYLERRSRLPRDLTGRDFQRAGVAGEIFRLVAAIDWTGHWLTLPHPERALRHLRIHLDRLLAAEATLES